MTLDEHPIYGSSRLGVRQKEVCVDDVPTTDPDFTGIVYVERGWKKYELSNHLGNVLTVITDRRSCSLDDDDSLYYEADIISITDYYPFGSPMEVRTDNQPGYRFGFNGKENDNETYGTGNALDFGARIYDSRLGRWLSTDPLQAKYADLCPYNFVANRPIIAVDDGGKDFRITVTPNEKGGGIITISTTAHIYGTGAEAAKVSADAAWSGVQNKESTYIDQSGNIWTVKFDITFNVNHDLDALDQNKEGISYNQAANVAGVVKGDVFVCSDCPMEDSNNVEETDRGHSLIRTSLGTYAVHGTFHAFGLIDRYKSKGDVMAREKPDHIDQDHFEEFGKQIVDEINSHKNYKGYQPNSNGNIELISEGTIINPNPSKDTNTNIDDEDTGEN